MLGLSKRGLHEGRLRVLKPDSNAVLKCYLKILIQFKKSNHN